MPKNIQTVAHIQCDVYENGLNLLGLAKVTLPAITQKVVTLTGAGIGGDLSVPIVGMTENMELSLEFFNTAQSTVQLLASGPHTLDLRVVDQLWDVPASRQSYSPDKFLFVVLSKQFDPGEVAPFTAPNSKLLFDVVSYTASRNGKILWQVDKRNMTFIVNGFDYMKEVRIGLGRNY